MLWNVCKKKSGQKKRNKKNNKLKELSLTPSIFFASILLTITIIIHWSSSQMLTRIDRWIEKELTHVVNKPLSLPGKILSFVLHFLFSIFDFFYNVLNPSQFLFSIFNLCLLLSARDLTIHLTKHYDFTREQTRLGTIESNWSLVGKWVNHVTHSK